MQSSIQMHKVQIDLSTTENGYLKEVKEHDNLFIQVPCVVEEFDTLLQLDRILITMTTGTRIRGWKKEAVEAALVAKVRGCSCNPLTVSSIIHCH